MIRFLVTSFLLAGLVGCAQTAKKADAPATDATAATDAKAAPAKDSKDAKAAKKADGKKVEAKAAEAAPEGAITCSAGQDKRLISVKAVDKGCEVVYDKNGTVTAPGSAQNGTDHCKGIQEKIKTNLENAGFTCS